MIKSQVKACLERCVALGAQQGYWPEAAAKSCQGELGKDEDILELVAEDHELKQRRYCYLG